MRRIFNSDELETKFRQYGFVCVQLFTPDEFTDIKNFYANEYHNELHGFHSSLHLKNEEIKAKTYEYLNATLGQKVNDLLFDYRLVTASFVVKEPGNNSEVIAHQDWSLVDERKYVFLNAWTPLEDLTKENGVIQLIPGTHKLPITYRGTGIEDPLKQLRDQSGTFLKRLLQPFFLKKGQVLIYDARIIHQSPENVSQTRRIACALGFIPQDAQLIHYSYNRDKNRILKLTVKDIFFVKYSVYSQIIPQEVILEEQIDHSIMCKILDRKDILRTQPVLERIRRSIGL